MGCGPSAELNLVFADSTPEQYAVAQEAVDEWNATCPVTVRLSKTEGEVPILLVPAGSLGEDAGLTRWHWALINTKVPDRIRIDERYWNQRVIFAHEIGHALGKEHSDHGIMLPAPFLEDHVMEEDCP